MLSFKIHSGKSAGREISTRRFPFSIGRASTADLVASDPGVWDDHALLELHPAEGFLISSRGEASVLLNGTPVKTARIRNGDTIRLGGLEFTCWLSAASPKRLGLLEGATWTLIAAVLAGQAFWLYRLILAE